MSDAGASSRTLVAAELEEHLRRMAGAEHVHPAKASDAISGVVPRLVVEPDNEQRLAAALQFANEAGAVVVPRGGGTKLGWGNAPLRADVILSTARLNRILEHAWADLTVTVEAGCTVQTLQQTLAQHGQRLAVDPLWPERATVGGILSTNESGALRLRFGGLRDLIIGVTLALPDGTLASSGGKVVKNVAGYDLPKLATGALGTLGVITRAVFRLHPLPKNTRTLIVSPETYKETQLVILAIQDAKLAHTALQVRAGSNSAIFVDVLFDGTEAGISAQEAQLRKLLAPASVADGLHHCWRAREELWDASAESAIAKISFLPAEIAVVIETIGRVADSRQIAWKTVIQATGLGWLRLDGPPSNLHASLVELRKELERSGGSLSLLHGNAAMPSFDAWGTAGDALPLMRALKHQLDPKGTLNPGRFVGGI
jgi:glycolate dehydrogenase FAD-binding subunit